MSEKITDLQLPLSIVARLIKEALPPNAVTKNEAKLAICRAASVFVLFLTSATTDITTAANQKTMTANHVLNAIKDIEFENFLPDLEASLEKYRQIIKSKKERKSLNDANANTEKMQVEDNDDDDIEIIEDE